MLAFLCALCTAVITFLATLALLTDGPPVLTAFWVALAVFGFLATIHGSIRN